MTTTDTAERIGFVGLGAMGRPMARNLAGKGHDVTVFDVNAEAMTPLVKAGAKAATSLAELAGACDIIFTMLPNSQTSRRWCWGRAASPTAPGRRRWWST